MKTSLKTMFTTVIIVFCSILALFLFIKWHNSNAIVEVAISQPGMDNAPDPASLSKLANVNIGEFFQKFSDIPAKESDSWPQFRGKLSDNIVANSVKLADLWQEGGPKVLWSIALLGEGHAAPAVHAGRVYLLDYDEKERADALRCFSLDDGKEIWRRWYRVKAKRNHGISRTVPAVSDKYVVTIGPKCQVMCVDANSGDLKWGLDLVKDFGSKEPFWFTGQCPIINENIAIVAPCGKDILMMGVDCESGKIIWQTPNPDKWAMSHSSIMPVKLYGKNMYVYAALGGIVAVSAEKDSVGKVVWKTKKWNCSVIAPTILHLGEGRFFITAGYGAGSMVFQVKKDYSVEVVTKYKPNKGLASEQQTPIVYNGYIYGIQPKDGGKLRKEFVCYTVSDTMNPVWSSGDRFGLGPYIIADNKIYILNDKGVLTMIRLSSNEYKILGRAKIMDGHDAWGPIAIVGDKLLLRDLTRLFCLDVGSDTQDKSKDSKFR